MKYCDNIACDYPDEPLERISDYVVVGGAVWCTGCDEAEREEATWWDANRADILQI
jgi:hypothetical protein